MKSYVTKNYITGGWSFTVLNKAGGFRSISYPFKDEAKKAMKCYEKHTKQ